MSRPDTRPESVIERLRRLADKARAEGVRLHRTGTADDLADDYCFAENPSHGTWYVVSIAEGCTCPGYYRTGACKHFAALMSACGMVRPSAEQLARHAAEQLERAAAAREQLAELEASYAD